MKIEVLGSCQMNRVVRSTTIARMNHKLDTTYISR